MFFRIGRDQNGQNFAFVVLRRSGGRIPERFDPREGGVMGDCQKPGRPSGSVLLKIDLRLDFKVGTSSCAKGAGTSSLNCAGAANI